eukprot:7658522-Alexandrium_andersonii.AAC.1
MPQTARAAYFCPVGGNFEQFLARPRVVHVVPDLKTIEADDAARNPVGEGRAMTHARAGVGSNWSTFGVAR